MNGYSPGMQTPGGFIGTGGPFRLQRLDRSPTGADDPAAPWYEVEGGGLPRAVLVRVTISPEGRLICNGFLLGAGPTEGNPAEVAEIIARQLREVPLSKILAAIAGNLKQTARVTGWPHLQPLLNLEVEGEGEEESAYQGPRLRPGPKGHPRSHFEEVATAYRAALIRAPRSPMKALAEQFGASEATARRWVQRARDMGLLGESMPGRAGEQRKAGREQG